MTLIEKIKEYFKQEEPQEEAPPREIRDKVLESLRRERQFQMNQEEKKVLKETIAQYKRDKVKKYMFGRGDYEERVNILKDELHKKKLQKKTELLKQKNLMKQKSILGKNSLLNNKKNEFKRKENWRF